MASGRTNCYSVVYVQFDGGNISDYRGLLENASDTIKIDALRRVIVMTIMGQDQPQLLVPIIQFIMPSRHKKLKKLLHFYWEVCPKYNEIGKTKQEMILVWKGSNAIRNDLQHPNEYVCGSTLRFLQKISGDTDILEPLLPACRACLEHRHSYVRRNAILTIFAIYRQHKHMIPDVEELLHAFLIAESDASCRSHALMFLAFCSLPRAHSFLMQPSALQDASEQFQLIVVEVITKATVAGIQNMHTAIRTLLFTLRAASDSVKYASCVSLLPYVSSATIVQVIASSLIALALKGHENGVKVAMLNALRDVKHDGEITLHFPIIELLGLLSSTDHVVRHQAIILALRFISSRTAEKVLLLLNQHFRDSFSGVHTDAQLAMYSILTIRSMRLSAKTVSQASFGIVQTLVDTLFKSTNGECCGNMVYLLREIAEKVPELRHTVLTEACKALPSVPKTSVRGVLWIIGEHCRTLDELSMSIEALQQYAFFPSQDAHVPSQSRETEDVINQSHHEHVNLKPHGKTHVGSIFGVDSSQCQLYPERDRSEICALSSTLTKIGIRSGHLSLSLKSRNVLRAQVLYLVGMLLKHRCSVEMLQAVIDASYDRMLLCVQAVVAVESLSCAPDVLVHCATQRQYNKTAKEVSTVAYDGHRMLSRVEAEVPLRIGALAGPSSFIQNVDDIYLALDSFSRPTSESIIDRLIPLTGLSDPIYAEVKVSTDGFNVTFDMLLVNQMPYTLQNACIDFSTLGDLTFIQYPTVRTIAPYGFETVKASLKVCSTDTGVVFGHILWSGPSITESCVVLNDIHLDIMDYIKPCICSEGAFRVMWTEFEWENRVNVNSNSTDLQSYLTNVLQCAHMGCLTDSANLIGVCDFLSVNLYAKTIFGESALANLSLEHTGPTAISGYIRIRSKTQGIALSIGDRITLAQIGAR